LELREGWHSALQTVRERVDLSADPKDMWANLRADRREYVSVVQMELEWADQKGNQKAAWLAVHLAYQMVGCSAPQLGPLRGLQKGL
jgi:hypothetical protein